MLFGLPWPVFALSLSTGLGMTLAVMSVTVAGPAGAEVAPSPFFATVPYGLQFFATMAAAMPLASLFGRFGRKPVVLFAVALGFSTGIWGYFGVMGSNFLFLCLSHISLGVFAAALASLRFASAELVSGEERARALALTNFGGTFAALLGPTLARGANELLGLPELPAVYVMMSIVVVFLALLLLFTPFGQKEAAGPSAQAAPAVGNKGAGVISLMASSLFLFALVSGATSYGIMSGLMIGSSLEMKANGIGFEVNSFLIQFHVLAMFGPSLITGQVLKMLGQRAFFAVGIAVLAASPIAGLFAPNVIAFASSLILLGFGWNMLYVGGSAVIAQNIQGPQKLRSQGLYDTAASLFSAVASLTAAMLLTWLSWQGLMIAALVLIAVMAAFAVFTKFGMGDSDSSGSGGGQPTA